MICRCLAFPKPRLSQTRPVAVRVCRYFKARVETVALATYRANTPLLRDTLFCAGRFEIIMISRCIAQFFWLPSGWQLYNSANKKKGAFARQSAPRSQPEGGPLPEELRGAVPGAERTTSDSSQHQALKLPLPLHPSTRSPIPCNPSRPAVRSRAVISARQKHRRDGGASGHKRDVCRYLQW